MRAKEILKKKGEERDRLLILFKYKCETHGTLLAAGAHCPTCKPVRKRRAA